MSSIAAEIAAGGRDRLVLYEGRIYGIRRVNSDQLLHVGWAALEGTAAVRQVEAAAKAELLEFRQRLAGLSPEQIRAENLKLEERKRAHGQARMEAMVAKPEGQLAMLERCTAYLCAAVHAAARALPPGDLAQLQIEDGPLPDGIDPALVAEPLVGTDPPRYLEPIQFVRTLAEEDPNGGKVWVHRLGPDERVTLGMLVIHLQSVAQEVAPFRRAAGAAGDDRQDGAPVLPPPARAALPHAGAGGLQHDVPRGRNRRGHGARSKGQGDPGGPGESVGG